MDPTAKLLFLLHRRWMTSGIDLLIVVHIFDRWSADFVISALVHFCCLKCLFGWAFVMSALPLSRLGLIHSFQSKKYRSERLWGLLSTYNTPPLSLHQTRRDPLILRLFCSGEREFVRMSEPCVENGDMGLPLFVGD